MLIVALMLVSLCNALAQSTKRRVPASSPRATAGAFDKLAKQAAEARDANRLDEAIALYRQALKQRPSWAEGWWYLGTTLYEVERFAEAREALRRLIAFKPDGGPTWALIGLCEFQLREYQQALAHLSRARALGFSGNRQLAFTANYHAALLLTRFEQFEAGAELLTRLAKEHPANPAIVEAFGINLLRLPLLPSEVPSDKRELVLRIGRAADAFVANREEEARREFEALIRDYPQTPHIRYTYGVFLLPTAPDEALVEFRRELQISPRHVPALLQLAFEYLKRNDYAAGLPLAEQAVQIDPNSFPARNALGRLLLELGQTERAIKELEAGVKLAPDSPEMHFALARAYSKAGRKTEAAHERAEFLKLDRMRRAQHERVPSAGAPTEGARKAAQP